MYGRLLIRIRLRIIIKYNDQDKSLILIVGSSLKQQKQLKLSFMIFLFTIPTGLMNTKSGFMYIFNVVESGDDDV